MGDFTRFPISNTSSSSSSTPSFVFGSTPSPSFGSILGFASSNTDQNNEEATIKKIIEAVELLEKKSENGVFPRKKWHEIKQEVEHKYPNILTKNSNTTSHNLRDRENNNYDLVVQEQHMNRYIQSQMSQIQKMELQFFKKFEDTPSAPRLSPDYDANYGYYKDDDQVDCNSGLGSDGCSALSFLGSLLGGFGM